MLDFRQLLALRAVAERGSVLAAAEALGWSQPTVTHHLNGLARVTGSAVVESSRAGTRLTAAGELWLPHAMALLDRADRARAEVADALEHGRRSVRIGIFPTAAARLLPALVSALSGAGLEPRITEGERHALIAGLDRLSLDAAVVFDRPGEAPFPLHGARRTSLFSERFSLIASAQDPRARSARRLRDFRDDPWILGVDESDPGDEVFRSAARIAGFEPKVGPRTDDYQVVVAYVTAGLGVALVPEYAIPADMDGVTIIDLIDTHLSREVSLLTAATIEPRIVDLMASVLTRTVG